MIIAGTKSNCNFAGLLTIKLTTNEGSYVVAGALVADYAAAKTDYISKVSDTADAEFGAIIKANHSTLNNDVTYMGFVQYVDASGNAQTIFYETAGTAALSTNYNNIVNAYLARYPFAA